MSSNKSSTHPTLSPHEVWESRYSDDKTYRNHYPWSCIVSFLYRHFKHRIYSNQPIKLLEVGCGNGSNLWFAAREGFDVSGIDISHTAIEYARKWLEREGLNADLREGNFETLPYKNNSFDVVIDRSALTFSPIDDISKSIVEIRRVLRPNGVFYFNPLSDVCSSFDGPSDSDGCYRNVQNGTIRPGAPVTFFNSTMIRNLFNVGWSLQKCLHVEETDMKQYLRIVHAEWHVEVSKIEEL